MVMPKSSKICSPRKAKIMMAAVATTQAFNATRRADARGIRSVIVAKIGRLPKGSIIGKKLVAVTTAKVSASFVCSMGDSGPGT